MRSFLKMVEASNRGNPNMQKVKLTVYEKDQAQRKWKFHAHIYVFKFNYLSSLELEKLYMQI